MKNRFLVFAVYVIVSFLGMRCTLSGFTLGMMTAVGVTVFLDIIFSLRETKRSQSHGSRLCLNEESLLAIDDGAYMRLMIFASITGSAAAFISVFLS